MSRGAQSVEAIERLMAAEAAKPFVPKENPVTEFWFSLKSVLFRRDGIGVKSNAGLSVEVAHWVAKNAKKVLTVISVHNEDGSLMGYRVVLKG